MKSFKDYVKNREISEAEMEVVKNPKVKLVADYDGPTATAPDQGKNSVSYAPANKAIDPNKKEAGGFADLGAKNLVYNPDTKGGDSKTTALGKTVKDNWLQTKSEAWNQKIKAMDLKESIVNFDSNQLPKLSLSEEGKPFPSEVVRWVTILGKLQPHTIKGLVHEMKREGNLKNLIEAILEHPESYEVISNVLSESESKSRMLSNSMQEGIAPPLGMHGGGHDDLEDQDDDEHHDNDDDDDSGGFDDEDEPHDEFGDDDDDSDEDDMSDDDDDMDDHDHEEDDDSNGFDDEDGPQEHDFDDDTFDNHPHPFKKRENTEFRKLFKRLNS